MIPNTETTLAQAGYIQLTGYQSALPTYSPWHYLRNIGTVHHHNASILSAGLVIGLWDCPTISLLWGVVVQKADVELRAETCCKIPPGQDRTPHHHLTSQMLPFILMSGYRILRFVSCFSFLLRSCWLREQVDKCACVSHTPSYPPFPRRCEFFLFLFCLLDSWRQHVKRRGQRPSDSPLTNASRRSIGQPRTPPVPPLFCEATDNPLV